MTLDVVGSNPTIYPLKLNFKNLYFLKEVNLKKTIFNLNYNIISYNIFFNKNLYDKNIKLLYYYRTIVNNNINYNNTNIKNTYYIILNKKKNHYYLNILENNKLYCYLTVGTMLQFFNLTKKCLRRSKKGFNMLINCFKKFFNYFNVNNINLILNFLDFNFILLKKNFFKNIKLNDLFFLKLNNSFNFFKFKKYKNIRKRLKKKFIKKYIL